MLKVIMKIEERGNYVMGGWIAFNFIFIQH
jgi:hypothetical protein